jgi:hypothetical protein
LNFCYKFIIRKSLVQTKGSAAFHCWQTNDSKGFYYVITKKGMKRASADVGFMFIAYNLRRLINITGSGNQKNYN